MVDDGKSSQSMAKGSGESKLALVGVVTLAVALAGVLLVKEALRSSRPVGIGLDVKQSTGEQSVRARLWEDPVAAVQRGMRDVPLPAIGLSKSASGQSVELSLAQRLRPLRLAIADRIKKGEQITVLLVTISGDPYAESVESRIRDRYAVGTALGVACYVPEDEGHLSFIEGDTRRGASHALPYEWYRLRETRICGEGQDRARSTLVIWIPDDALSRGFLATFASLSQALVCQESTQKSECLLTDDRRQLVRLNPTLQQAVTFKIVGPRSSSALRDLLDEAGDLYGESHEGVGIWPNVGGTIELYSPWASAMKGLLAYGLKKDGGKRPACQTYEACEQEFSDRLASAKIRLAYGIGSDDRLFDTLIAELERRQVRLGWDAVILIGEWDSFYGRALPIEFRAAACAKVATFTEAELKHIQVPTTIKAWCPTVPRAVDLQIQRPADYESLTLNVFRYSYLSGLDGEVPGSDSAKAERGEGPKATSTAKDILTGGLKERPEGTSQLDYVRALATRIQDEGEGAKAIGILGTDSYDALLILKALRPVFPHAVFFTVDLDARHLHASEYKWTRNMVVASPFGLQLDGSLQRDVPPFRSSYQTATYFAVLQAVSHVTCRSVGDRQRPAMPCTAGYHVALTPEDRIYDAAEHPRIFEVGREGAVDVSVVDVEGVRTIHPLRADLEHTGDLGQLKQGISPSGTTMAALAAIGLFMGMALAWMNQRLWLWVARSWRLLAVLSLLVVAGITIFWAMGGGTALMAHHDEGEPFSWTAGVSIWPGEWVRFLVVALCLVFLVKGSRDLMKNSHDLTEDFLFRLDQNSRIRFTLRSWWTTVQRIYHPSATRAATTVDQAWSWYLGAADPLQRAARVLVLFLLYGAIMLALDHWVVDEEMIQPCRGWLSCRVDAIMTLISMSFVVLLNLAVFDEVMLCRRWVGWVNTTSGGWSEQVQQEYLREYGLSQGHKSEFDRLKYLAGIDLISRRTEAVNRLIRYPFIALLVMIAARNDYFDIWNYPVLLLLAWAMNAVLALSGALLLYQSADRAKRTVLVGLSKQMLQALGLGKDQEVRAKQVQYIIGEVEANQKGAFVPFYQQPVVESSLYGIVALLQYLYLK
jgi:hypothetical protein